MAKSLKELYGLREMAMEVPDKDVAALGAVVKQAILNGELPAEALNWLYKGSGAKAAKAEPKVKKGKQAAEPEATPAVPATSAPAPKAKAAAPPPTPAAKQPVPSGPSSKTPGGWAAWKAQTNPSAWDALAGKSKTKATTKAAPPEDEFPDLPAPKSANVKLNKHGQPLKGADDENPNPDMFAHKKVGRLARVFGQKPPDTGMAMQPKRGALSRIFGKKQPQFQDNPYEFTPGNDWTAQGDPFASTEPQKKNAKPAPLPDDESGEDAMATLGATLAQNPAKPKDRERTGTDAMSDLDWDLKRSKGK